MPDGITLARPDDVQTWYQSQARRIFLGDVVDPSNSDSMSVGFSRYAPGEANNWVVTYDEALVVTRGSFSVTSADGQSTTADAGEVIFLRSGTKLTYSAGEAGADVVYVAYPHWMKAQENSEHAALLDTFHPIDGAPPATDARSLLERIWDPIVRGESGMQPFFDALAEDVVFELPVGELRGKGAVIDYFAQAAETMVVRPFEQPVEYYGDGNRVIQLGPQETFTVKETGVTHRSAWAWVFDVHDGAITRILAIQDLSGITDEIADAVSKAQRAATAEAVAARVPS
jgi:ethanolamine utilization protein EutQ